MAQWLTELAACPEDLGLISQHLHGSSPPPVAPVSGNLTPSFDF